MIFSFCEHAAAQDGLNGMIKSQEEIDKNVRKEGQVERKDVFADSLSGRYPGFVLPVEANCIVINNLRVEGDFSGGIFTEKVRKHAVGRCIGAEGIAKLATDLQDFIIQAGYVTSRVMVPDQDLSLKTLHLKIVSGKIGDITIKNHDVSKKNLPLKDGDVLNLRDVEQGLELMQRVPGARVKIDIEPSAIPGYSNIVINTDKKKNWNVRTWVNNWGDENTGKILAGGAFYFYNQAGLNDVFYVSGNRNIESSSGGSYQSVSGYYSLPFGYWDYEAFYSTSKSIQNINLSDVGMLYTGRIQYLELKASKMLYRDKTRKVSANAKVIKRKVNYDLSGINLQLQKRDMTNLRVGVNYKQRFSDAMLDGSLSYQRFLPWLDSEETPDMLTGDVSKKSHVFIADADYFKLLNFNKRRFYYNVKAGGQYTPAGLTLQDQISIGSRWSVRGFENSKQLEGNSGFYIQNTIAMVTGILNAEWYFGVDYGQLWSNNYGESRYDYAKLMGVATGVKGNVASAMYNVFVSTPLVYPDTMPVDNINLNFELSYHF